jgi:hypothetical protein
MQHRLGASFSSGQLRAVETERDELARRVHDLERVVADRDAHLNELRDRLQAPLGESARRIVRSGGARLQALLPTNAKGKSE